MKSILLAALGVFAAGFVAFWVFGRPRESRRETSPGEPPRPGFPSLFLLFVGFITNFFDTLGIGSFATISSIYKIGRYVPDEFIPGTMNVGNTLPVIVEALIFISIIRVDFRTLVIMIAASVVGAWLGAGIVASWPRRIVQIGLGIALLAAALLMLMSQFNLFPVGGDRLKLAGLALLVGAVGNFILGALNTLGVGLYAPCMILVSLLAMNPKAAFPIMMGSCAFLMPVGSARFIRKKRYNVKASLGLAIGGVPAVLLAAFLVKSLPLAAVRWLVVVVVIYTAGLMLHSAMKREPIAE